MPRRRRLTAEDEALWAQVAARAVPLRPSVTPARAPDLPPPVQTPKPAPQKPRLPEAPALASTPFKIGQAAAPRRSVAALAPTPAESLRAAAVAMDGKTHRRLTRGKLRPDARIDLHGMTLAVAEPTLRAFIQSARGAGKRLVLVITGKGRAGGPDAPLPVRPGALRHYVPHWLHSPPLAASVLQVTPAHLRHGGDGAYYVYLRR